MKNLSLIWTIFKVIILPLILFGISIWINSILGIVIGVLCFIWFVFVYWCYAASEIKDNPIDEDDPDIGSKAEERRKQYFINNK
jgi:hypothetical protein